MLFITINPKYAATHQNSGGSGVQLCNTRACNLADNSIPAHSSFRCKRYVYKYIRWSIFQFCLHHLNMANPKSKTHTKSTPKRQSKTKLPREMVTKSFDNGASQITLDIPAIREYKLQSFHLFDI